VKWYSLKRLNYMRFRPNAINLYSMIIHIRICIVTKLQLSVCLFTLKLLTEMTYVMKVKHRW